MPDSSLGTGKSVLVVDDHYDFLRSMEELLSLLGFRVFCARDGAGALKIMEKQRPNISVILTDLFMPNMDGIELLSRLRSSDRPLPPVIAVTGDLHVDAESVGGAAASLGASAVLIKPFSRDQLASAIGFVCSSRNHSRAKMTGQDEPAASTS
jgi:CheY-like chemotaxis protein